MKDEEVFARDHERHNLSTLEDIQEEAENVLEMRDTHTVTGYHFILQHEMRHEVFKPVSVTSTTDTSSTEQQQTLIIMIISKEYCHQLISGSKGFPDSVFTFSSEYC